MMCRFSQLRRKEVINICDGSRLGCVGDLELCIPEGTVKALIVFGPCRFFGLFGRGEDYYIPWDCVQRFGEDIILIDKPFQRREGEKKKRRLLTHGRAYRCGHVFTLQKKCRRRGKPCVGGIPADFIFPAAPYPLRRSAAAAAGSANRRGAPGPWCNKYGFPPPGR